MKLEAKVLIVGGGPAGSTAARLLAGNKTDVILLERNLSFVKPCGGGVPSSAFKEFNIPKVLIKKEVKCIRLVSPKNVKLDIELRGGNIAIVRRGEFDQALRNAAVEQGAKVVEGECIRVINDEKFYRVEASIGGANTQIISEYIIAADGVNSRVRTALGIKPSQAIFTVSEHIQEVETASCEFWFSSSHAPGLYSWVFPATDGISAGTGCILQGTINFLFEKFKERRGIISEKKRRVYRIPLWKGDLFNKGKVIFAGDSAGQVLPFTYEGIYYAMRAGELAGRAIIEGKTDNYKKMWKNRFQKRFTLMDKLKSYFLKDDASAEKFVSLHKRPEVQEASIRLWLRKDSGSLSLKEYIRLFGKFLS
jgi:geranylgeranyl reductase